MDESGNARFLPADGGASWCLHPPGDLLRVYEAGAVEIAGRRLCGLCGEMLFLMAHGPHARGERRRRAG